MQDAFAYCGELVRTADRDRFIASLFAPVELRGALHALYAFNAELARVRDVAREPLPGEIRLQWWADIINGERRDEANASPVATALLATIQRHGLSLATLSDLIEARRFDLYQEPMASIADLESYARKTSSAIIALSAQIIAATEATDAAEPAGIAYAIAGLLRALPTHLVRGQLYLPAELLQRHQVQQHDLFAGRSSAGLEGVVAELRATARLRLTAVRPHLSGLPQAAIPALLPVALVRSALDRLERSGALTPAELPAWRRQLLIWRAARNPARIAG
jgi:15-cis-phytoene synthase